MEYEKDPGINNFKDKYGLDNKEDKKLINEIYGKLSVCCDENQFEYNEKCDSNSNEYKTICNINYNEYEQDVKYIKTEQGFIDAFGNPNVEYDDSPNIPVSPGVFVNDFNVSPYYGDTSPGYNELKFKPYKPSPDDTTELAKKRFSPGVPYMETDINYAPPTPMSTDDLKDKLIADLDQERHDMIDTIREKEKIASEFEYALRCTWLDLCDAYDNKSSIKEVSKATLHNIYKQITVYMSHCPDYADRDLTKKIKKEIEQTKVNKIDCFDNF